MPETKSFEKLLNLVQIEKEKQSLQKVLKEKLYYIVKEQIL